MKKIVVVGAGYVGMANALFFSMQNEVYVLDIDSNKIDNINRNIFPCISDDEVHNFIGQQKINITATLDPKTAYDNADLVIIAVPTNFNLDTKELDTSVIDMVVIQLLQYSPNATIVIKSTVPIGYTDALKNKYDINHLIFSPEFLRMNSLLYDMCFPNRIVIGSDLHEGALDDVNLYKTLVQKNEKSEIPILVTGFKEAESIKLFSNSYLAMRVAFFNELDSFAETNLLNPSDIIKGVCLDVRIGDYYNNPSFGYGGYCLPKDSKQLLYTFRNSPNSLIKAIVQSNEERYQYIYEQILRTSPNVVGFYRINMKKNSDDLRESAVWFIMDRLMNIGKEVIVYEPIISNPKDKLVYENSLETFKLKSDLIVANRYDDDLEDVSLKVYSRDIYNRD